MDKGRTNNMANIFVKFAPTYRISNAFPTEDSWKKAILTEETDRKNKRNGAEKTDEKTEFALEDYSYTARAPDTRKILNTKRAELDGEDLDHVAHDLLEFNDYSQYGDVAVRDWAYP
jgi:hypothetical protein